RTGILPSRHACEAIELITLNFTPSLMSETQPGRGLEYRSVNVPIEFTPFRFRKKAYLGKRLSEQVGEKGYKRPYQLLYCAGMKENTVFTGGVGRVFT